MILRIKSWSFGENKLNDQNPDALLRKQNVEEIKLEWSEEAEDAEYYASDDLYSKLKELYEKLKRNDLETRRKRIIAGPFKVSIFSEGEEWIVLWHPEDQDKTAVIDQIIKVPRLNIWLR